VVTYTIEVDTDNSDGRLLPYLTANALFQIGRREDVLLVPNEALRWTPKPEMVVRGARTPGHDHAARGGAEAPQAILWLAQGHQVRPLKVEPGLTDGTWTEVAGAGLREGVPVVTGESVLPSDSDSAAERNPFAPPRFPWQQRGGKGQEPSPAQGPEPEPAAPGANRKP
jgi:HlyD family secretion protein